MKKYLIIFLLFFSGLSINVFAGVEVNEFDNKADEQRFKVLINELRCLVCQNQNLADSNAELAQDLRKEVYQMIQKGQSNDEIVDFMVTRYGDFVLYRPPFNSTTLILWLGPFIILTGAVIFLILFIRKKKSVTQTQISDEEKKQADVLLKSLMNENKDSK